ncbi:C-terminal binding protein AN [Apostasia shenzhenica]|uniref:C-terminal binding protein AN n=1 Tax=Apostasia shenzhenica TaxID=1088818 RepID=A0A2I0AKB2_9ASPA|nr:C-terminal binding protein AN [Apostasia shenzhenica]
MRGSGGGSDIERAAAGGSSDDRSLMDSLPLIVSLNCLEDTSFEFEALRGVASVEHVPLSDLADGRVDSAAAVLIHSLAFLPSAAQRRLQPRQLILCLGSTDRAGDSALAADLGLLLVHVDASRSEEIADTVMSLFLALLRRTHLLLGHNSSSAVSGWLGSIQPLCCGMRRCRGLVLGIIGKSASARCLATRSLAFRMNVLYFDLQSNYDAKGKGISRSSSIMFPHAARRMDTLNDLLAASDLVSLHCAISEDTLHILNAECLQHIKPGAFIVNTSGGQLIDDCALKQLLLDGTIAGCALDGVEGPQWMEAWVREMPNVLILPKSADYSEDVWMEIREKAISMLQSFFLGGAIPDDDTSDEDGQTNNIAFEGDQPEKRVKEKFPKSFVAEQQTDGSQRDAEYSKKLGTGQLRESQASGLSQNIASMSEEKCNIYGKKSKKRPARQSSQQKSDEHSRVEGSYSSQEDDTAISGIEQSSRFTSPEDLKNKQLCLYDSSETTSEKPVSIGVGLGRKLVEFLKDGFVIALHARDHPGLYVSRQRLSGGGWFLDMMSNVTKRDPAAQFLVAFRSKFYDIRSSWSDKLSCRAFKMVLQFPEVTFEILNLWHNRLTTESATSTIYLVFN